MSIRVAIVEDDVSVRESLSVLINDAPGFRCEVSCSSAEEALERLPSVVPEVVLMDIHLPGKSGIECVTKLKMLLPQTQIVMLTIEEESQQVFESLKAGANGYLVKSASPERILEAIAEVHSGGAPMSSHIARSVVAAFRKPSDTTNTELCLSPREEEVLRLLAKGNRSKEIAEELGVGVGTVNTYVRHIYEKLHVRSRAEAVARLAGH